MMNQFPAFRTKAVKKSDLASNTPLINVDEIEYFLWIEVPNDIFRDYRLVDVAELGENITPYCILKYTQYAGGPWYKVDTSMLNKRPGYHRYCMKMVNIHTDDVVSIFFAYILQDDSPEKPYKYMENSQTQGCCCNVDSSNRIS